MARNPKQDANLGPPFDSNQSREEASKNGRKGGIKSGEVRRRNRDARKAAQYVLNLAAKGQLKENLKTLGYAKDANTNRDALFARLLTMAIGGNLEAANMLLRYAGEDPKENRDERESRAADKRRERELDAKLTTLGQTPEGAKVAVGLGNEDGQNDVVIYIPEMLKEEDCLAEDAPAEGTESSEK